MFNSTLQSMKEILEILKTDHKHKEKVSILTEKIINQESLIDDLVKLLQEGNDVEKGTSAEIMKFVSKEKPELLISYIDTLIDYIDYKTSRVKWGVPETLGNLAQKYPEKVTKAIPKLLENTKDKSTVVRWCAAYALTEIAKNNSQSYEELFSTFNKIIETEQNNGVRNVYLKAMKVLAKEK